MTDNTMEVEPPNYQPSEEVWDAWEEVFVAALLVESAEHSSWREQGSLLWQWVAGSVEEMPETARVLRREMHFSSEIDEEFREALFRVAVREADRGRDLLPVPTPVAKVTRDWVLKANELGYSRAQIIDALNDKKYPGAEVVEWVLGAAPRAYEPDEPDESDESDESMQVEPDDADWVMQDESDEPDDDDRPPWGTFTRRLGPEGRYLLGAALSGDTPPEIMANYVLWDATQPGKGRNERSAVYSRLPAIVVSAINSLGGTGDSNKLQVLRDELRQLLPPSELAGARAVYANADQARDAALTDDQVRPKLRGLERAEIVLLRHLFSDLSLSQICQYFPGRGKNTVFRHIKALGRKFGYYTGTAEEVREKLTGRLHDFKQDIESLRT